MYGSLWLNGHHDTKNNVAKHTMHLCSILFMLRFAFQIVLSVVMLYVNMMSVIMLSVIVPLNAIPYRRAIL
jgi:hypothetical protein